MKKIILLLSTVLLLSIIKLNAQTVCDSISFDTAVVGGTSLQLTVYNSSNHSIVYPFFVAILDANPYIALSDTLIVVTFLSTPNDPDNGYSTATYAGSIAAAATVPYNTLFTGTLTIEDPNDSAFVCSKPFSFLYGDMVTSVETPQNDILQLYPNPTSGQFTISLLVNNAEITVTDLLGKQIMRRQITEKTTNIELDNNGVYIICVKTNQGTITRKIIVNR